MRLILIISAASLMTVGLVMLYWVSNADIPETANGVKERGWGIIGSLMIFGVGSAWMLKGLLMDPEPRRSKYIMSDKEWYRKKDE